MNKTVALLSPDAETPFRPFDNAEPAGLAGGRLIGLIGGHTRTRGGFRRICGWRTRNRSKGENVANASRFAIGKWNSERICTTYTAVLRSSFGGFGAAFV